MVFRQRKSHVTNIDFINIVIISVIFSAVIITIGITKTDGVWGSKTDWISQHFAVPEYFRTRFYRTGDLFPDFAFQLGAGQNIYNFAYYGLMNPVYLLSYLLPQVRMPDYIQVISIMSVYFSCIACYFLTKRHFSRNLSLILSIIFMCSAPLIFHSHRHIMFVNYLPFQLLAMICTGNKDTLKNRAIIIFCSYSVMCTSFYFSIGAFASIIIYAVFIQLRQFRCFSLRRLKPTIICIVSGIITAGILWIPTFFTLIRGRESGSVSMNIGIFFPEVNLQYLLYSPYSAGLTFISVFSVITMLKNGDQAMKFISSVFAFFICCPLIVYILNGTMYLDAKVLIPFLPLIIIVTGGFLEKLFSCGINVTETALISLLVISAHILMNCDSALNNIILTADALITVTVIMIYQNTKKQAVLIPIIILSFTNCFVVNFHDSYVSEQTLDALYSEDIQKLVDKAVASDSDFYRFADGSESSPSVNRIYGDNYYTTNMYSSVSNPDYRNFRFENSFSENSHRNNALQTQPKNIIFNALMGCRYRIGRKSQAMTGETIEDREGEWLLFKNKNALPVGYACSDVMNEKDWKKLNPAQRSEAMLENIIIPSGSSSAVLPSDSSVLNTDFTLYGGTDYIKEVNDVYEVKSENPFSITAKPESPIKDKIIFIEFHADNRIGTESERNDISVTINGVKNTLSDPDWKYNNKNYDFSYVISSDKPIEELVFDFSAGNYILSDFNIYTLDTTVLGNVRNNKDCFVIDRETNGDTINGNIDVTKDGWFNLSVPYDDGFEITVDGVNTDYFRTNTAFIGFPIKKGSHFITVNYHAPYRTAGIFMTISGIGISTYAVLCRHTRRKIYSVPKHVRLNRKGKLI